MDLCSFIFLFFYFFISRQDPVHSGAAVQVLMDLWGVLVSCIICTLLLNHDHVPEVCVCVCVCVRIYTLTHPFLEAGVCVVCV